MPISTVTSDPDALTLTLVGDYPVPVERLWEAFADPRQLQRFWGPPSWPATFTRHDLVPGGRSEYHMTGPDGERAAGYWIYESVEPGVSFEVVDGFANDDGTPNDEMPTIRMRMEFASTSDGSRFTSVTTFASLAIMEQLVEMGMVEGSQQALGQMDDVLADLSALAAGRGTEIEPLDATTIRVTRLIRGSVEQVWRAHHDAELVRRWMLGPDGWTMPVCEMGVAVGDSFRWEWESDDGRRRFGFEGELLEMERPRRWVGTERPIGTEGAGNRNETTLIPIGDGTLLSIVITTPTPDVLAEMMRTGMVDGMERSYERLEGSVLSPA